MRDSGATRTIPRFERILHGLVAVMLAGIFVASLSLWRLWPPDGTEDDPQHSYCLLRRATGLPCPTCGLTRSFCAFGVGDVWGSLTAHPLGPVAFAMLGFVMVRSAGLALTGRGWLEGWAWRLAWSVPGVAVLAVVVWAGRIAWMVAGGSLGEAWRASVLGRVLSGL